MTPVRAAIAPVPFRPRSTMSALCSSSALALALVFVAGTAMAQDNLRYDSDDGTAGFQNGAGDWNTTDQNWQDGGANTTFSQGDNVLFSGPGNGATVTINEGAAVRAGTITVNRNGYTIAGDTADDRLQVVAPGGTGTTINVNENTSTSPDSEVELTISTELSDGGEVGTMIVDSNSAGRLVLTADNVGANVDGLTIRVQGGTLETTGDLSADIQAAGGGTFEAADGTVIGGDVRVDADGEVIANDAEFQQQVTVDGANALLRVRGGDFVGGIRLAEGEVRVTGDASGDMSVEGGLGRVQAGGELQGAVTVSGGQLRLDAASGANPRGTIDGNVTLSGGELRTAGAITGALTVNGGTVTGTGEGTVAGLTTVDGAGVINTGDANFGGGVLVTGTGEHNVTGDSSGRVRQNGGTVTVAADGTLRGRLTQDAGTGFTTTVRGTVAGDVIKDGGTLTITSTGEVGGSGDVFRQEGGITNNRGDVGAAVTLSGGEFNQTDGDVSGAFVMTGGQLTATGGAMSGGVRNAGGTVVVRAPSASGDPVTVTANIVNVTGSTTIESTGRLSGAQRVDGGTMTNQGRVTGSIRVNDGTLTNTGRVTGTVLVAGGVANQETGGTTSGLTTVQSGGRLNGNGGSFAGGVSITGTGRMDVNENTTGNVTVATGASDPAAGTTRNLNIGDADSARETLTGNVRVESGTAGNNGTVTGTVTVAGGNFENRATGRVTGAVTVTGGEFTALNGSRVTAASRVTGGIVRLRGGEFDGGLTASGGGRVIVGPTSGVSTDASTAISNVDVTVEDGGQLDVDAGNTLNGVVTATGGQTTVAGTVDGNVTLSGTAAYTGAATGAVTGTLQVGGTAEATLAGGTLGGLTTLGDGQFTNTGSLTVGGDIVNGGSLDNSGTIAAAIINTGTVTGGGAFAGGVVNNTGGTIVNSGAATDLDLSGGLTRGDGGTDATAVVDMTGNSATGDEITVGGGGTITGQTFRFNVDPGAVAADQLVLTGGTGMDGTNRFEFVDTSGDTLENPDDLFDPIKIIEATNGGTVSLPPLSLSQDRIVLGLGFGNPSEGLDGDDVYLQSTVNPAYSAVVGNIILTQSLIGSVINRPTQAPYQLDALEQSDPCRPGIWGRALGGRATANGDVNTTFGGSRALSTSEVTAAYTGIQLGGDLACTYDFQNGKGYAVGGVLGLNQGKTSFGSGTLSFDDGITGTPITIATDSDFTQRYAGVYGVWLNGPWTVDLQFRSERTTFDVQSTRQDGSAQFQDTSFDSKANTLSGSVSYSFPLPNSEVSLTPRAGFAWTRTKTDQISLVSENGTFTDTLTVDDFDNRVGFVGIQAARSRVAEDGLSAHTLFGLATVYSDFASAPTATVNLQGQTTDISSELSNLGTFGELSVGWNYFRVIPDGGSIKQLSATIRADGRFGSSVKGWGLTGQVRLQF